MAQENDLHLISKMRRDAALYEKYEGEYSGRGPKNKYGTKVDYNRLPTKYWKKSQREGELITNYLNGLFLHKEFGQAINVVIIERINLKTKKVGHAILFSSDVGLDWEKLLDYYSLRFQIEFNFREAKQHFGLEDFMNTTEKGVENAANLAFLMVNVSAKLIKNSGAKCVGVLDLKTHFRGVKYALETIKILLEKPETILSFLIGLIPRSSATKLRKNKIPIRYVAALPRENFISLKIELKQQRTWEDISSLRERANILSKRVDFDLRNGITERAGNFREDFLNLSRSFKEFEPSNAQENDELQSLEKFYLLPIERNIQDLENLDSERIKFMQKNNDTPF